MKKIIEFNDILGNTIQFKTSINTIRQLENKPCWIVESRKLLPRKTDWSCFCKFENQYFVTDEDAQKAVKEYLDEYIKKAKTMKKIAKFEETTLI